jgi:molybdopterin-containing oxidoreductase family iron-sulfur binding subunit
MSRRNPYEFEGPAPDAPVWWTSLDDYVLQQNPEPEARAELSREFSDGAWDFSDPVKRRSFMTLMGAAVALGTLQGCRRPVEKILPYSRTPDDVAVNITSFYATVAERRGEAVGLLVESHEGRPTKVEGNPDHPASRGRTDLLLQASVLDLYDPDRARQPSLRSDAGAHEAKSYAEFETALRAALEAHGADQGAGLRVLAQPSVSPTFQRLRRAVIERFPQAKFHTWDAGSTSNAREGAKLAFGRAMNVIPHFETARVIVSVDCDFLQTEPGMVRNNLGFARSRRVGEAADTMSRLYAVESNLTTTGSNADHRLRLAHREIEPWLMALAGRLVTAHNIDLGEVSAAVRNAQAPTGVDAKWVNVVAADLARHPGASLVLAGSRMSPTAHALVHAINQGLGNAGQTVAYASVADEGEADNHAADLTALADALGNNAVRTLIVLGGNPVYDAPANLGLGDKVARVPFSVHVSSHHDETCEKIRWHVPRAHYLESWGDAQSLDGSVAIQQPLIQALFSARSDIEILGLVANVPLARGYDLVRETARGGSAQLGTFEREWRRALNLGALRPAPAPTVPPLRGADIAGRLAQRQGSTTPLGRANLEVVFAVDAKMYDGRHANNAWLQELPDPITKITWDNAAIVSPHTAEELGVGPGDMLRITKGSQSIEIAAWPLPGHADNSITLALGWGRSKAGRVGTNKGVNVNPLRSTAGLWSDEGYTATATGAPYKLSQTQEHHRMEGRPVAIEMTLARYLENPNFAERESPTPRTLPLWQGVDYSQGHQWGMAIDLNACTGCNACAVACQAENNIPVVGKEQVSRGREMHWLRVDRYFVSPKNEGHDTDPEATSDPRTAYQPLACVQCENAPCENVCPVTATSHGPEGLNDMAYNRCIGTRYCANNCPYKVRRFNYLNWHNDGVWQPEDPDIPEIVRMQMNPSVTVRFRGVMEKCTYCVQRIQNRKIEAKREENRPLRDGEVVTACAQACPADAIVFGDLNDRASRVRALSNDPRRYKLLGEIGTRPRTTYLAKVRNPNPEMLG